MVMMASGDAGGGVLRVAWPKLLGDFDLRADSGSGSGGGLGPAAEYSQPVAMRNSTGWSTGARKSAGTSSLRARGITLITLGAFALVAAGTATQVDHAGLAAAALTIIGVVACLAGWRIVVVARRREHSSD
jgi:hypothetical protein